MRRDARELFAGTITFPATWSCVPLDPQFCTIFQGNTWFLYTGTPSQSGALARRRQLHDYRHGQHGCGDFALLQATNGSAATRPSGQRPRVQHRRQFQHGRGLRALESNRTASTTPPRCSGARPEHGRQSQRCDRAFSRAESDGSDSISPSRTRSRRRFRHIRIGTEGSTRPPISQDE